MPRSILTALIVAAVAALAWAASANASALDVIRDCSEDGALDRDYSRKDLSKALDQLPSDLDEYTDCRSVIRGAQLAGSRGGGKPSGKLAAVDTASPPSAPEQREISQATSKPGSVEVGGRRLTPGSSGTAFAAAGLGTDLPTLVLLVLIALGAAMAAGAAFAAHRRWPQLGVVLAGSPLGRAGRRVRDGISRLRR